ncbi:3-dehydrosphinganine reductase [Strigomonas culicis]|uniref:3-dehydrosphinganine reductase n=1 Tax=Strigomonas culicis TaxID=28005 RepID=S9UIA2_9TRYP|nr:3-dehydrosphinganine reductase [Strigomonas culicis]|eukprot:EPY28653.1 3-dehydrosphinganine reductase [Strigomonas culicis]
MDSTPQNAQDMMRINYFGCLNLAWAFMPAMLAQGRGRVVLMSSMAARAPIAGYTLYAATKAALRAFAHSVDMENSCLGVRVQVVSPPDVETPGFEHENTIKSPECAAISAFGGAKPFQAPDMGAAVVAGIARYRFDITLGSDGWLLSHGAAAMEPPTSTVELLEETLVGGVIRLGLAVFAKFHYNIVRSIRCDRNEKKAK